MSVQGLGGEGAQLAWQGEASSGAILGEFWGPWGQLLTHHELGNLQRTESIRSKELVEGEGGDGETVKWIERRVRGQRGSGESGDRGQEDRKGLEGTR